MSVCFLAKKCKIHMCNDSLFSCLYLRMSKGGRTIIFSIHQPRFSIFKLFDSLTLLASGRLMFHGPAQEALEYFASAGEAAFSCIPASLTVS